MFEKKEQEYQIPTIEELNLTNLVKGDNTDGPWEGQEISDTGNPIDRPLEEEE